MSLLTGASLTSFAQNPGVSRGREFPVSRNKAGSVPIGLRECLKIPAPLPTPVSLMWQLGNYYVK